MQCDISEREQAHQIYIAQFIILTIIEVLRVHKVTFRVLSINPKHGATINVHSIYLVGSIGSPTIAPTLSTGIWPDRRGGGRAFYSLVLNIHRVRPRTERNNRQTEAQQKKRKAPSR